METGKEGAAGTTNDTEMLQFCKLQGEKQLGIYILYATQTVLETQYIHMMSAFRMYVLNV